MKIRKKAIGTAVSLVLLTFGVGKSDLKNVLFDLVPGIGQQTKLNNAQSFEQIPDFNGTDKEITLNNNVPIFTQDELSLDSGLKQTFSDLDHLNRVGEANAMLHKSLMPTDERGDIGDVYPSGWKQKQIGSKYLYNRSHLIAHRLTGEDANWKNLFTGTSEMNQIYMGKYERQVDKYLTDSGNHVRYRVTPYFKGDEKVCRGVNIEAASVEDNQLAFNVFIYNVQDNVDINYSDGSSTKTN